MPGAATSNSMTMNTALTDSQQQFDAIKRSLPQQQPGGMNRLMMPSSTASSTHQSSQPLLHQQLNSQAQAPQSQVEY